MNDEQSTNTANEPVSEIKADESAASNSSEEASAAISLPSKDFDEKKYLFAFSEKDSSGKVHDFYILKPNRNMRRAGEIEYAKRFSFFVKNGLLPRAAFGTLLENLGGTISDSEALRYADAKKRYQEASYEYSQVIGGEDEQITDENKEEKLNNLLAVMTSALREINAFETDQVYIFENTAEAKARNETIQWWMLTLSKCENDTDFFIGKSIDEKLDWIDSLDLSKPDEKFLFSVSEKFSYFVTMWFLGRLSKKEDFERANANYTP